MSIYSRRLLIGVLVSTGCFLDLHGIAEAFHQHAAAPSDVMALEAFAPRAALVGDFSSALHLPMKRSIRLKVIQSGIALLMMSTLPKVLVAQSTDFSEPPSTLENIAFRSKYYFSVSPNYADTQGLSDFQDLTNDAKITGNDRATAWVHPESVVWREKPLVFITVDLGKVQPIRGVSLTSAGGAASVKHLDHALIFVSDDKKSWRPLGDLVSISESAKPAGLSVHTYWTDKLHAHGQYVAYGVRGYPYSVLLKLKVYKGEASWLAESDQSQYLHNSLEDIAPGEFAREYVKNQSLGEIRELQKQVSASELSAEQKHRFAARTIALEKEAAKRPAPILDTFSSVFPLNDTQFNIFQLRAEFWKALGFAPLTLWNSEFWDLLTPTELPSRSSPAIQVHSLRGNDLRSTSVNLSNATSHAMTVSFRIEGLPKEAAPDSVQVHSVIWNGTRQWTANATTLAEVRANNGNFSFEVLPGLHQQLWLSFRAGNLSAQTLHLKLHFSQHESSIVLPVEWSIHSPQLPLEESLHGAGWDYTNLPDVMGVKPKNQLALIENLRAHGIDSPWGTKETMPFGGFDEEGKMIEEPSTQNFDQWVSELWPLGNPKKPSDVPVAGYFIHLEVLAPTALKIGDPHFATKVAAWVKFWTDHLAKKGIDPHLVHFLLKDEPDSEVDATLILTWIKALQGAHSPFRIWEDPEFENLLTANQEMLNGCDELCFNFQRYLRSTPEYRNFITQWVKAKPGRKIYFYSFEGDPATLDPYAYYRLPAWIAQGLGASGWFTWGLSDWRGVPWKQLPLADRPTFTLLALHPEGVMSTKQQLAWQEGLEDATLLKMAQEAIEKASQRGVSASRIASAQEQLKNMSIKIWNKMLADYAAHGLSFFEWSSPKERHLLDGFRLELIQLIENLNKETVSLGNRFHEQRQLSVRA